MRFDITDQAEPGTDLLGLPLPQAEKAVRRLAMLRGPGENPAAVELLENRSMHRRDLSRYCVAPSRQRAAAPRPALHAATVAA